VAGGDPNLYRYCLNDPLSFIDPYGTDLLEKLRKWYMGGMGGFSQWVDRTLMGGATENFGRTVGEYECGNASGWDVIFSGLKWGGGLFLSATTLTVTAKGIYLGGKLLVNLVSKKGTTAVYQSVNAAGQVQYVGITNNLARRTAEHARNGIRIRAIPGLTNLSKADARAVEQVLIELHGLGKNGGTLLNKINSIAKTNPCYAQSLKRGRELLLKAKYPGVK
jgi:uncharacterized protein RhaS with RHS repeats